MKKISFAVLLFVLVCLCGVMTADAIYEKPILFRGIEWGTSYNELVETYPNKNENELFMIDIHEICIIDNSRESSEIWTKISYKTITGWIIISEWGGDPCYQYDSFKNLGSIEDKSKTWTIRKYNDDFRLGLYRNTKIDIKDNPGSNGNIIAVVEEKNKSYSLREFETMAVAEDEEDYYSGFWIKIEYEPEKYGWIFQKNNICAPTHVNDIGQQDPILETPEWLFFSIANYYLYEGGI